MMRCLAPALCASLVLAGCQTADQAIQHNLGLACAGVEASHALFTEAAASISLKAAAIKLENDAHDDAVRLCANPGTNTQDVTVAVLKLSVKIGLAVADAKRVKDAGP